MVVDAQHLMAGALCCLFFTPSLYKFGRVFFFWLKPEPFQRHMQPLTVSGLLSLLLLKLERKEKPL